MRKVEQSFIERHQLVADCISRGLDTLEEYSDGDTSKYVYDAVNAMKVYGFRQGIINTLLLIFDRPECTISDDERAKEKIIEGIHYLIDEDIELGEI